MLFDSINYFIFLFLVVVINYSIPAKFRWIFLLAASAFFYLFSGASTFFVPVIIILSSYFCAIFIEKTSKSELKKTYFMLGLFINLGLLVFFKYINFFIATALESYYSFKHIFSAEQILSKPSLFLDIAVPLGISYVTFQAIGYLIEVKRGNEKAEKNLGMFAAYLLFFPKLLSGPIERANHFLPQLRSEHKLSYDLISKGSRRILWGLFLKLVVANRLALYTDAVFSNSKIHSGLTLFIASLIFAIQLFADFAGYTEIALGSAQLLGFKLMENFDRPFIATTVTEFWRRWHISLTSWVNDYIFTPIVVNRRNWNTWGIIFASILTFVILGFWHGASWNFIIFGLLQGIIISLEFLTRKQRRKFTKAIPGWLDKLSGVCFVYLYFSFSVIFFKIDSVAEAFSIVGKIFTFKGPIFFESPSTLIFSLLGISIVLIEGLINKSTSERFSFIRNSSLRDISYAVIVIMILLIGVFDGGQFIYFKF